jgi:hypothetical protein
MLARQALYHLSQVSQSSLVFLKKTSEILQLYI